MTDLSQPVADLLGITLSDLGTYLLYIVMAAPVISAARPYVEPVLVRWRESAALTATTADDVGVRVLAALWGIVVAVPAAVLRLVPVFVKAAEAERISRRRADDLPPDDDGVPTRPIRPLPRELPPLLVVLAWAACTSAAIAAGALS